MNNRSKKAIFQLFIILFITILTAETGLVFSPCFAGEAGGQCDFDWKPGEGLPGVDGDVYALTTWDPDGNGPQQELLIAGGDFTVAGDVLANNIAAWDGNDWQPLGSGMNSTIRALTVYNGELIAGGEFTTAGGVTTNSIARWDGSSWQPLGTGMNSGVRALTVYNGELIAGGNFTTAGGVAASKIARWDGGSWQALGSGMIGTVYDLTVYNGELIAGGYFTTAGDGASAFWAQWGLPEVYTGDLNHDCFVDLLDMDWFTERWLNRDCLYNGWCYEADLNYDLTVDFADFATLASSWLSGW